MFHPQIFATSDVTNKKKRMSGNSSAEIACQIKKADVTK